MKRAITAENLKSLIDHGRDFEAIIAKAAEEAFEMSPLLAAAQLGALFSVEERVAGSHAGWHAELTARDSAACFVFLMIAAEKVGRKPRSIWSRLLGIDPSIVPGSPFYLKLKLAGPIEAEYVRLTREQRENFNDLYIELYTAEVRRVTAIADEKRGAAPESGNA